MIKALLMGSEADLAFALCEQNKAIGWSMLWEYCRMRYNRHSAFRREMRKVVGNSKILGDMVEGL